MLKLLSTISNIMKKLCLFRWISHPFYQEYLDVYENYHLITISLDFILFLIVQWFSYHLCSYVEYLREEFVNFDGQKQFTIDCFDIDIHTVNAEDWMTIFLSLLSLLLSKSLNLQEKNHRIKFWAFIDSNCSNH